MSGAWSVRRRHSRIRGAAFLAALLAILPAALGAWAAGAGAPGADQPPEADRPPEPPHDATTHQPFTGVEKWAKIFDDPKRDEWQKPKETVAALGLEPGDIVADLGAGTGYFERYLSRAVAPSGIVLAIDTEAEMVHHLGERALREQTLNVVPVLALPDEPFLPPGRVDCVLIVDTYHHIDDRLNYFRRMKGALAPGGRVAVVDFHKREAPVGPPVQHKLAREFVVGEMKQAGWSLAGEKTFLQYHYFLIFQPATH